MAKKFLVALDLVQNELQNARMQNLAFGVGSGPATPVKGQMFFNTTDNVFYWWDGSQWIPAKAAAGATPAGSVTTQAVGDAPVVGVSTNFAREDHKHGREAFAAATAATTFGLAKADGSAATLARSDHHHGTPTHDNAAHSAITLASLSAPFGTATADLTFGSAKVDGAATTAARSDHTHGNPTHDNAAHSAITLNSLAAPTADRTMGGFKITGLGTPGSGTDATTKDYVDNLAAGLAWKDAVRVATTTNITLSGTQTIDGVAVLATESVLVKNQSTPAQNGIYVAAAGAWARRWDSDTGPELLNATVFVAEGTQADTAWVCTTNATITPDTTPLTWVQFGAGTVITAGAGLVGTNTIDVVGDASITVTADQISRAALTGDVTAAAGSNATTIALNAVTNAKSAQMNQALIKGRAAGAGIGDPQDLTPTQVKTALFGASPIPVSEGGTGNNSFGGENLLIVSFGATGTGGLQPLSGWGAAGQFLGSNGGTALPSWQNFSSVTAIQAKAGKYATATVGGATSQVITHNLATRDVVVQVYRTLTPWDTVECDVERTTVNTVTLRFAAAPAANEYTCVAIGGT